jgi:hypothetical protein
MVVDAAFALQGSRTRVPDIAETVTPYLIKLFLSWPSRP